MHCNVFLWILVIPGKPPESYQVIPGITWQVNHINHGIQWYTRYHTWYQVYPVYQAYQVIPGKPPESYFIGLFNSFWWMSVITGLNNSFIWRQTCLVITNQPQKRQVSTIIGQKVHNHWSAGKKVATAKNTHDLFIYALSVDMSPL